MHTLSIRDVGFYVTAQDSLGGSSDSVGTVPCAQERPNDERAGLRERLLESLLTFAAPVVEAQHRWSRFSRHALWSMVTSSWGAQFTTIARQLGDAPWGIAEARATFALEPEIARAAPELYEVRVDDAACTCQKRAACCLHFKRPGRGLCASCPILSEAERLGRNRQWVRASRPPAASAVAYERCPLRK